MPEIVESAYWLPINEIWVEPLFNCRETISIISVEELARSIEAQGLHFPVIVQPREDVPHIPLEFNYRLIVGFRRFKAITQILKQSTIKGVIRSGLAEREARILNLLENIDRKDLNILEEAKALAAIYPPGTKLSIAAEGVRRHPRWCSLRYHLLKMPPVIQEAAVSGLLTQSDIQMIASVAETCQLDVFKRILEQREIHKKPWHTSKAKDPRPFAYEVKERMEKLVHGGLGGFVGRILLWAAGMGISDEIIDDEIQQVLDKYEKTGILSGEDLVGLAKEEEDADDVPQYRITRH